MAEIRWEDYECDSVGDLACLFFDLSTRGTIARHLAGLVAAGDHDPARHGDPKVYPPLTVDEQLAVLAMGEAIARQVRHPAYVHDAVRAGATWQQIAAATGTTPAQARAAYREWAYQQHRHGLIDDAEYRAAYAAAARPDGEEMSR
jgi:hypothetical protein